MSLSPNRANFSTAWAPAKVNLYLHVGSPGAGGLHPLDSLVVFADTRAADRISARSAPFLELSVEGPGAKHLKNAPNNLTMAAAIRCSPTCTAPLIRCQSRCRSSSKGSPRCTTWIWKNRLLTVAVPMSCSRSVTRLSTGRPVNTAWFRLRTPSAAAG